MTARTRYRKIVAAAVAALVAPLALTAVAAAPAHAALVKHKHEVTMYKLEKYIKLKGGGYTSAQGDTLSTSLSCYTGDSVLDGMWVVDHVDQYQPPQTEPTDPDNDPNFPPNNPTPYTGGAYNDERDVQVWESYPSTSDTKAWNFKFTNYAWGDAQLHVYITCIKGKTEATNSHTHNINVSGATDVTPGGGVLPMAARTALPTANFCTAGQQYVVAPGFKLSGSARARLLASFPKSPGLAWEWDFVADAPTTVTVYAKCIDRKVSATNSSGGNHSHAILMYNLPDYSGHNYTIDEGDATTRKFSCDEDNSDYHGFKAAVGWFYMNTHWQHHWFLGMEPQPKSRVFHFLNRYSSAESADVLIGALCINSRTGNPFTV